MAEVYIWKKDYKNAERIYKEVLSKDPKDFEAYSAIWNIMLDDRRYMDAVIYFDTVLSKQKDRNMLSFYVKRLLLTGDYRHAIDMLRNMASWEPNNMEVRIYLADVLSYNQQFAEAELLYEQALEQKYDRQVKGKLADVLSWDGKYKESVRVYDELLAEKEERGIRLEKARVLGWAKQYARALAEYKKILDIRYDELVDLEMRAKRSYWYSRVKESIGHYSSLIAGDPQNTEAIFNLAQVYSYQSMWQEAETEYKKILVIYQHHFRAREGLEKTRLLRKHILLKNGYEFLEQDSSARDSDVRKSSYFSSLRVSLGERLSAELQYRFNQRNFFDFSDINENETRLKFTFINNPGWWLDAFYNHTAYNRHIRQMHTFGVSENFRVWDMGILGFSQERERLENNSTVVRNRVYRDNYKERLGLDINKRLKAGADYLYSSYSDGNSLHQPGLDILYSFSIDPKRLSLKYRYFYQDFRRKLSDYFSPKGFCVNSLYLNWRHSLNKGGVFFGADELYYDLGYETSCDSHNIVSHKFSAELNWDVNKRLNLNIHASTTDSSCGVYRDKNIIASVKYYF